MSYTDKVEQQQPMYLHELYHYAIRIAGSSTTFEEIACAMNEKSRAEKACETLKLQWYDVNKWFRKNKGKEKSCIEKPYPNDSQKQA
jgi:hypothetical protein